MHSARLRALGRPMRTILAISKKPFGDNGGHLQVLHLECGHTTDKMSNSGNKVGKRTGCPECR